MIDTNTFLTTLYVVVDDFCKQQLRAEPQIQPMPSLARSEVVTLALFGQWNHFPSERAFCRYADHHLRNAFPRLPDRSQLNRLIRRHLDALTAFFLQSVQLLRAQHCLFEALDSSAVPTRDAKRRGSGWWLASILQIVETVNAKLHETFRLQRERPHDWTGLHARLTAKVALHNFCIGLNQQLGRANLAFADLIDW